MRLIHTGRGQTVEVEEPVRIPPIEAIPARSQVMKRTLKSTRALVPVIKTHTNYKPGSLTELGSDQCRYTINDENHMICGAKVVAGKSWCAVHYKIIKR